MKKILIALPLVLVMLLSMIPVMADEEVPVKITAYYYEQPDSANHKTERSETVMCEKATATDKGKLEAWAKAKVASWPVPHDKSTWTVKVTNVVVHQDKLNEIKETKGLTVEQAKKDFKNANFDNAGKNEFVNQAGLDELKQTPNATLAADKFAAEEKDAAPYEYVTQEAQEAQAASATATVKPDCKTEKDKEPTCVTPCSEITVKLHDVHNNKFLDAYQETFKVDDRIAPDYQSILDIYLRDFFPWKTYQPLKNYLNVYSILTPKNLTDCEIIIEVLPKFEKVQIIHELYDCCITPDGKVKEDLAMSFIEDDQAFLFTGVPDGFMGIPFLEFHTGLMVNQDKAAEYAKTRLEKVNATDFVFQEATFYDGIKTSAYVKGVVNMTTGKVTPILNDVPTIVIKYLRGECVKNEQKVDNAKVEAGVQTTTNAPAQQLPATGAKDITAFFMSAVALLGLGIFFAKKH